MKKLMFSLIILSLFPIILFAQSYDEMWKKVDQADRKGLPQTALKELEPIYNKAVKEKNHVEAIKSVCKKISFEGTIQGNLPEEKIIRFEQSVKTCDPFIQPLLNVILANHYFNYYQRNRYKFLQRSKTSEDSDLKDFKTWDLPRLFTHISKLYDSVLEQEKELSAVSIKEFKGFLIDGNQPEELRSNIYEFLIHEALKFYSHEDQSTAKPQNAFEIDADSKVFDSIDEFINWKPESLDTYSPNYKSLKLYQKLLSKNKTDKNTNALLNNNIERIIWAKKVAVGADKDDRYLSALKLFSHDYPDSEYSATAYYLIAKYYSQKEEYIKAIDYAEKANKKWPQSYGGLSAYNLIQEIKTPSIKLESEKILLPEKNSIKIEFRNLNHAYFRLIKRPDSEILEYDSDPDYINYRETNRLISTKPDYEFDTELDPQTDYKNHFSYISLPKVNKGFYWLVVSANSSFSSSNNAIYYTALQISNLSLISKTNNSNGNNYVFAIDSVSGKPIEGAEIKLYEYKNREKGFRVINNKKTNKEGFCEFSNTGFSPLIFCSYKDDKVYMKNYWREYYNSPGENHTRVYFFTDRAIYRPGQTVYFKAIAIDYNQSRNEYKVLKNHNLEIGFNDPNNQRVNRVNLTTNEFGSCTGTFITPTDRLTGNYSLKCYNHMATSYIKVEEYKRPKFKVQLDSPTEGYQLGQKVSLKGKALSYTGAVIDNAEVKFRVVRQVRYPYWCWWIRPSSGNSQEINHGIVKTDSNGEFTINFEAKPDKSIDKSLNPLFSFAITADVTDNTGETRSNTKTVRIGYTALDLRIDCKKKYNADNNLEFSINTATHDGKPVQAEGKIRIYALNQPEVPNRYAYMSRYYGLDKTNKDITDDESSIKNMKEGKIVFEKLFGTDTEGKFTDNVKLPEGIYRIKVESEDRFGKEVKAQNDVIAISHSSTSMSVKLPFFFEVLTDNLKPGDTFKAFWATGYKEGPAYIEITHRNKVLKSYWSENNINKEFITCQVTEEMRGGFYVNIFQVKENRLYVARNRIDVNWTNKNLNLKLVHFTSKMEPSSKESWKVEISGEDAELATIEMLASMYDASLDAYAGLNWPGISVFYHDFNSVNSTFSNSSTNYRNIHSNFTRTYASVPFAVYPSFPGYIINDFYGYGYPRNLYKGVVKSAPMSDFSPKLQSVRAVTAPPEANMMVNAKRKNINSSQASGAVLKNESLDSAPNTTKESKEVEEVKDNNEDIDLSNIKARSNLNETAFFLPQLTVNDKGIVTIDFEMPEALTTWKFMGFAHGTKLQTGAITQEVITQKELMIQPNAPRFLREGDKIAFTVKVTNLSDVEQTGSVALELFDAITDESRNAEFKNNENKKSFKIPAKQSKGFSWILDVPYKPGFVKYKAVGATKKQSDGEEGLLPILSSRILVIESQPLPIRGPETKNFKFEKLLKSGESKTLEHKALTVEITSNPAWYAVQALPYLIEFPHECSEQTFNRIYANKLAAHIANSNPKIRKVFDIWAKDELYNKGTALMSNLEKNQHLKSVTLMETPWVLDAKNENEQKHKIGVLFQKDRLTREIEEATKKLKFMQLSDGSFPWFPGGRGNTFITLYIMTGYGRLRNLGVDIDLLIALKCADFMDRKIVEIYEDIIKYDKDFEKNKHIDSFIAFYLYGRSFFLKDRPIPSSCRVAVNYFIKQGKDYWLQVPYRMSQAHIALGLQRFGDKQTPIDIVKSIKERSVTDDEMGRFWREKEIGYSWNRADIETQAMMIEMFSEITHDEEAVEDCKVWLLKQKQTQCWKTTKSTADAIYALILKGVDLLASDKLVTVSLADKEVKPEKVEVGTGYYQKIYSGAEVKPQMGKIQLKKEDKGVAWGAVHWQYIEDMSKVTPFENNLKLKKSLFIKTNTVKGPVISPVKDGKVRVGDLVVVRIELRTDRDLEFVHLKDQRGSGMEPVNVISRYKWQDGLGYYEATKDSASHFYIDYLPKGTYVFEYELRVQLAGTYQTGISEIMCMYAPEFNSHSESFMLNVDAQ